MKTSTNRRTARITRAAAFVATLGAAFAATACGPLRVGDVDPYRPQSHSMNGVKLLAPEIKRGDDPASFGQERYALGPSRRLLLRFESLSDKVSEVVLTDGKGVEVDVGFATEAEASAARAHLRLCPITRNWMMLATWESAHPFSPEGRWNAAGGDVDETGCATPSALAEGQAQGRTLTFEMSAWFVDYPQGRGQNYGLALLSDADLGVLGELSGSYSPRIRWVTR